MSDVKKDVELIIEKQVYVGLEFGVAQFWLYSIVQ